MLHFLKTVHNVRPHMGILDKLFDKHAIQNTLARELTKPVKSFGTKTHFSRTFYQLPLLKKWSKTFAVVNV